MKRYIVIITILLNCLCNLLAQEEKKVLPLHPQIGAEWYYTHKKFFDLPNIGFTKIYVEKDTIINNYSLKKVVESDYEQSKEISAETRVRYWYYDDGKCYEFSQKKNKEDKLESYLDLLYDIKANKGDTLQIVPIRENCINSVIVQEREYVEINGYKTISLTLRISKERKGEKKHRDFKFTQLVGFLDLESYNSFLYSPFKEQGCYPKPPSRLRYFEDKNLGFSYKPEGAPEKDYIYIPNSIEEIGQLGEVIVFYNNGRLSWKHPQGAFIKDLRLYTIQGENVCIYSPSLNDKSLFLPIPKGTYIYHLKDDKGRNYKGKIQI